MSAEGADRKRSGGILKGCAFMFFLAAAFFVLVALLPFIFGGDSLTIGKDKIAVVEVIGAIIESDEITAQIEDYADDASIKGIVVRVDSPGGAVGPSQEIYEAMRTAKKQKPVVASFGAVAASGGYYLALGADKIVSNPGTITGSIGVIMGMLDVRDMMSKLGLTSITIKSGEFKDIGSPSRKFTERDKEMLQGVIDDVYGQFMEAVSENRHIPLDQVKALSDGRIFSGKMALEKGLVDELGTFQDAVKLVSDMAGIEGKPHLVRKEDKFPFLKELISGKLSILDDIAQPAVMKPGLHYLWTGF